MLAIDPGQKGALVVFEGGIPIQTYVMPLRGREVDPQAFQAILERHKPNHIILERQLAYAGKGNAGVAVAFYNLGLLAGVAEAYGQATIHYIHPKTWQAYYPKHPELVGKEKSIHLAQELYPNISLQRGPRARLPHDGIADALLLGHYWLNRQEIC